MATTTALTDEMVDILARQHGVDLDIDFDSPHTNETPYYNDEDSDNEQFHPSSFTSTGLKDFNPPDEVALTAMGLGIVGGVSGLLVLQALVSATTSSTPGYWQLPLYILSLSVFHFLEYYITARYNRPKVKASSFLLRNGTTYIIAHVLALSEAILEYYFFSGSRNSTIGYYLTRGTTFTALLGFSILLAGQALRSLAMIHASTNFSHVIARTHADQHILVQTGVYSFSRHPSYSGFFFWALGTQVLLANPVSFVFFSIALWRFFSDRIQDEEVYLGVFFGKQYAEYKKTTPTRIPFIN